MNLLIASAVVIPVLSIILFALLEAVGGSRGLWATLCKVGLDLCIVSIGIVGGMFLHQPLVARMGPSAPIVAMVVSLTEMILAATVMLVEKRWPRLRLETKAYISIFVGAFAVALPSGIILWVGSK